MNKELTVLYASQTGTGKQVAEYLARDAIRQHYKPRVMCMDAYSVSLLSEASLLIFICSTTGQGDNPDNMKQFCRFLLQRSLPPAYLHRLNFTVFGLGDSTYEKYNFTSKRLHRRLEQLGAHLFHPRGFGDDHHPFGFSAGYHDWVSGLWPNLKLHQPPRFPSGTILDPIPPSVLLAPLNPLIELSSSDPTFDSTSVNNSLPNFTDQSLLLQVTSNRRITALDHNQDVRSIDFLIHEETKYSPGNVCYVYPQNSSDTVNQVLLMLGFSGSTQVKLASGEICSLKDLFTCKLDVWAKPRPYFFELLSHFAKDDQQKAKLAHFGAPLGASDLYTYCYQPRRTCLEVLGDFFSCHQNIPIIYFCELFPAIQPRAYSIASSQRQTPRHLTICVALVNYKTKQLKTNRTGLASNYLRDLKIGDLVRAEIRADASISLPPDPSIPLVMVGPGTGIAPFRGFIQDRAALQRHAGLLVFGNRYAEKDFLYRDELVEQQNANRLFLALAFSRDQPEKRYVQHVMKDRAKEIYDLIDKQHAVIYVCGKSGDMPKGVQLAFLSLLISEGKMSKDEAHAYLASLKAHRRYNVETW